jgi:hypothetical protein
MQFVPVLSASGQRLIPCNAARARQLIRAGRAIKRHDRSVVYLVLLERESGDTQPVALGIDPGSKKEAFVVQSTQHTLLSLQADAVTWVGQAVQRRRVARRLRRGRKCPRRTCRPSRHARRGRVPPSTRARWGLKVRIAQWPARYDPLTTIVIEDIKAPTKPGKKRWNRSFSPLEVGKRWCYGELAKIAVVRPVAGYVTKALREEAGLPKSGAKRSERWDAHCVDAFVLANAVAKGPARPTSVQMLVLVPLQVHRRQLHRFNRGKDRPQPYGGSTSLGLKRGSWVRHPRHGLCYVGGTMGLRISLHSMETGKRLTQAARPGACQVYCTASWRVRAGRGGLREQPLATGDPIPLPPDGGSLLGDFL